VLKSNEILTCALDVGLMKIDSAFQTTVIEVNPPFALGSYGLKGIDYISFLHQGWKEMFKFSKPKEKSPE
jgi:hypothetical protein